MAAKQKSPQNTCSRYSRKERSEEESAVAAFFFIEEYGLLIRFLNENGLRCVSIFYSPFSLRKMG